MEIQLTAHEVRLSDAERTRIESKFARLAHYYPRLNTCRVVVDVDNARRRHGNVYRVRVSLPVPRGEVAVCRRSGDDLVTATRATFDATRRRLQDHARLLRGEVKRKNPAGRFEARGGRAETESGPPA